MVKKKLTNIVQIFTYILLYYYTTGTRRSGKPHNVGALADSIELSLSVGLQTVN